MSSRAPIDFPIVNNGGGGGTLAIASGGTGATTAAAAAVAIVNGNPLAPGIITFTQNNSAPVVVSSASSTSGFGSISGNPSIWSGGTLIARLSNGAFAITSGLSLGANPSAPDVFVYGTSNTWSQRNGINPQSHELYGTYTSATNYERLCLKYNAGTTTFQIGTEKGSGGGTARALELVTDGVVRGRIDTSGNFTPTTDATGALGTNTFRWNNLRVSTDVICTRIGHYSSLGAFSLIDGSGFDWGRLCFGGATSAYPAIKRVAAGADWRVGDDTAFAAVQSLYSRFGAGSPEGSVTAPVGCVFHRTDGGAGTSFYVKESGAGNTGWVAK